MRYLRAHWRLLTLVVLFGAPILTLVGFGMFHLWSTGLSIWVWWPLTLCMILGVFLGWRWQRKNRLLRIDFAPPLHWTERDRQAWHLVEERAKGVPNLKADQMTSIPFYLETAESMALELTQFYHPGAKDPIGNLTIPEILAVIELASRDLAEMVDEYVPGGHLLTINDLRRIKQLADWYPTFSNISWLVSAIFNPVNTAARYLAVQAGMSKPWQLLQDNILFWFFTAFIHRFGSYLIELNSGRLRVGRKYVALQRSHAPSTIGVADPADAVRTVTFALAGQAKAGKSSLINALLGDQKAFTDILPATSEIERYELQPAGVPTRFRLLDTVGYGSKGPREDQKRATENAARDADLILLVLHARNPARQADLDLIKDLKQFFDRHPELHRPPMLAVLTHIDLLSPSLEWSPPYNWREPTRPKEVQIHEAVAAVQEQLGQYLAGVVPVCTAPGRIHGIEEWLLPALVGLIDQAHAVAFLRCLKAEIDTGKIRKVFYQLLAAGKQLVKTLLTECRLGKLRYGFSLR